MAFPLRTPGRSPWLTALAVAVSSLGLYLIDRDLARIERQELAEEASRNFSQAERAASEKHHDVAIPLYRRALALERGSLRYRIALGSALVAAGQRKEAAPVLAALLNSDPNNGEANLAMARLQRYENDATSAAAYYHRAIYGSWQARSQNQALRVRLELAQMLADQKRERELLSELLLIEDGAQDSPKVQLQVARWYLRAGSPARAATVFRRVLGSDGVEGDAYEGLGDAELSSGNYRAAQNAYTSALRRGQKGVSERLVTTVELAQLDPTLRRLSSAERLQRSKRVLIRVLRTSETCSEAAELQKSGLETLTKSERMKGSDYEDVLAVAEDVWRHSERMCPEATKADATLEALMTRLGQQP